MGFPSRVPLGAIKPADVVLVPKSSDPVDLVDVEGGPEGDVRRLGGVGRPVTGIGMTIEIAAQRYLGLLWMLSDVEKLKVAEQSDTPFGRHAASPGRSIALPMMRVALGRMTWIYNGRVCAGCYADGGVLSLAVQNVPPRLRHGQAEVEEGARLG